MISTLHRKLCDQSAYLERCSTELCHLRNRDDITQKRLVRVISFTVYEKFSLFVRFGE